MDAARSKLIGELQDALAAETQAREQLARTRARVAGVLRRVRAAHLPYTTIACATLRSRDASLDPVARKREAARLRQQARRERCVTSRHGKRAGTVIVPADGGVGSGHLQQRKDDPMPTLVRRTIEEYEPNEHDLLAGDLADADADLAAADDADEDERDE